MLKNKFLIAAILFQFSNLVHASTWCSGEVTNIRLNTDYNNNVVSFTVNGVGATLENGNWSDEMKDKVLSVMLAAQLSGKNVAYWGSNDCTLIKNRLNIVSE